MSKQEEIARVVAALGKVPPKRLLLIDLANQIPMKYGELDPDVIEARRPEVNLALAEVKAYAGHVGQALQALEQVKPRAEEINVRRTADHIRQ